MGLSSSAAGAKRKAPEEAAGPSRMSADEGEPASKKQETGANPLRPSAGTTSGGKAASSKSKALAAVLGDLSDSDSDSEGGSAR